MQKLTDIFGPMAAIAQGMMKNAGVQASHRKLEKGEETERALSLTHDVAFKESTETFYAEVQLKTGHVVTILAMVQPANGRTVEASPSLATSVSK